ncbi:glycosyltransferase family 4 protein [Oligoflexus tunisiensis]|uniref:glycosyltransferase family 4 protein n=1 Tax=Oligoflexus tunisiensis TaxID=708132 RepID=UPI00114CFA41|nr:glycosyltransferase family 4 protein [Oligoflexus tunisiensis]
MKPLRILILSEQNNPDWISVPLVGYRHAEALARQHKVHLVTHVRNKPAHEKKREPFAEITYIDLGWIDTFYEWMFEKIFNSDFGSQALTAVRVPFYIIFEWLAWRQLQDLVQRQNYDCVLRLTPVAPVLPSPWARWTRSANVPFVIGPINGGLPFPAGYEQAQKQKEWISNLRKLYRLMPYARSTYREARAIIAGSSQTCSEFSAYQDKVFFLPENGITPNMIQQRRVLVDTSRPLQLLFAGRLVPFKACDLAIKGSAQLLLSGRAHLTIVGDGSEREALEELVRKLGLTACVTFTGMLSHPVTLQHFAKADVLVFPSIREFGGGVVFEALATGAVPMVSDYGGPGDIVHEGIGFKIPLNNETAAVEFIQKTLDELDKDRARLLELSRNGQAFAREALTWDGKAGLTSQILYWVLGQGEKPRLQPSR